MKEDRLILPSLLSSLMPSQLSSSACPVGTEKVCIDFEMSFWIREDHYDPSPAPSPFPSGLVESILGSVKEYEDHGNNGNDESSHFVVG